ncbi:hypothetical protein Q8A67_003720 [Cirrhinus molitorella]|uniref:Uncharacterized protein n=1 Tax=Cirrhinus molitorella TaxID=172907 RepID=A0AA88QA30_9TELE|nr:hypothetical protein Q8A67_003720 [Cirrhinus molitorella]
MEDAVAASAWSALEDGAHPEKQNEARNQQTRGTCEIGATQLLHRMQRTFIGTTTQQSQFTLEGRGQ